MNDIVMGSEGCVVASTSRFTTWAAAGLLLSGLFLALLMVLARGARAPSHPIGPMSIRDATAPAGPATDEGNAAVAPADVVPADVAPPELIATADELQAQYEQRKAEIPDELSGPLDEEMGVIEGAVASLLAAIAAEPENESLKRMLVATYRNEVRLLKKALHLSSESEDTGDTLE